MSKHRVSKSGDYDSELPGQKAMPEVTGALAGARQHLELFRVLHGICMDVVTQTLGTGTASVFFLAERIEDGIKEIMPESFVRLRFAGRDCLAMPGEHRDKRICSAVKQTTEGRKRCEHSERRAARAAMRTLSTQVYQCHAGLSCIMVPIAGRKECHGFLRVGQFLHPECSPRAQAERWAGIEDIPGVSRDLMADAFDGVAILEESAIKGLVQRLEEYAGMFGLVWEGVHNLAVREQEQARLRRYGLRELAEMLLEWDATTREDVEARAKEAGIEELPTLALVAQVDPTAWNALHASSGGRGNAWAELVAVMKEYGQELRCAFTTSVRPSEAVMLLRPEGVRNPALRNIQMKELSRRIMDSFRSRTGVQALAGVGSEVSDPMDIAASYREARHAMWLAQEATVFTENDTDAQQYYATQKAEVIASSGADPLELPPLVSWCREALYVIGYASELSSERARRMFAQTFTAMLHLLHQEGFINDSEADGLRMQFAEDYATFQSYSDIVTWFEARLLPCMQEAVQDHTDMNRQRIAEVQDAVRDQRDSWLSRRDAASTTGLSGDYFGKLFRKNTGLSFRDYGLLSRISQAQTLLQDPERTAEEVAFDVGYSSLAAFSRAFSRVCGVSPSVYRRHPSAYRRIRTR